MSRILDRVRHEPPDRDAAAHIETDIEMYVIEAPMEGIQRHPITETLTTWSAALAAVQEHARLINSPGGFVTPPVDFPTRAGFREDVRVTMHADPRVAGELAATGRLFADGVRGLRVDARSLRTHKTELSWKASLRTGLWRRRDAMLRISPSPSFQLTVIRLTPVKSQRIATRGFIRSGLRAAYALVARLERELVVPPQGLEP